jgi:hypothetical protein
MAFAAVLMINQKSMLRQCGQTFALPIFFMTVAGCGNANSHATEKASATPAGWEPICMGRLLVDLPHAAELADSKVEFGSIYSFNGIGGVETWGRITWGGASFTETSPTNREGLQRVASDAKRDLLKAEQYPGAIAHRHEEVADRKKKLSGSGTPSEMAFYKEELAEEESKLQDLLLRSKVSGVAKTGNPNEFAVRPRTDLYAVGFMDVKDHRVRAFGGKLNDLKPDSPEAAAKELRRWRSIYEARLPTEIPSKPGFCSSFGFFNEAKGPDLSAEMKIPFRLKQYPNLLFYLEAKPSETPASASIYDFPDMAVSRAHLDVIGVKHRHGPSKVQILGTPGRVYAQEYGPNCASKNDCRPADQAYEIHAETLGEVDRIDRPHLTLYMVAATSDEYKAKRKPSPGEPSYNTPARPALHGQEPPPFSKGYEIFEQILRSIRIRPGAIASQ